MGDICTTNGGDDSKGEGSFELTGTGEMAFRRRREGRSRDSSSRKINSGMHMALARVLTSKKGIDREDCLEVQLGFPSYNLAGPVLEDLERSGVSDARRK